MDKSELVTQANVELGKTLIEQAHARYNKERQELVIGEVQRLMRARDEYLEKVRFAEHAVEWYNAKLKALEAGEFEIGMVAGVTGAGGITFKKSGFQPDEFLMPPFTCSGCGVKTMNPEDETIHLPDCPNMRALRKLRKQDEMDNPRCYCPDCGADLGNFYSNRIRMVRDENHTRDRTNRIE